MISSADTATFEDRENKTHRLITWLLLAGLLFLRLPLFTGVALFSKAHLYWADPCFQIGTYLLTAILIWWERSRLTEFHVDRLAIAIIVLLKPVQMIFLVNSKAGRAFPPWTAAIILATSIGLLIALRRSRLDLPKIRAANLKWFVIGAGAGVLTAIVLGYPTSLQINKSQLAAPPHLLLLLFEAAFGFVYQLGYAAVSEEPLFRGFLWGRLRKAGWKEVWIWLFQAGLFMLGHIYYLKNWLISFYILVPVGALVYGFVAWRSRSIAASMAAHAAHNALGYSVGSFFARL